MSVFLKSNTRKIENVNLIKNNFFTKNKEWENKENYFQKKFNLIEKEINKISNIDNLMENLQNIKTKINIFVFSTEDYQILIENNFNVTLIETTNINDKNALNEISKKMSENLINILAFKSNFEILIMKDKLIYPIKNNVFKTSYLRMHVKNIKSIDNKFIKTRFNIPNNDKSKLSINLTEGNFDFYNDGKIISETEIIKKIISLFSTKDEFESYICNEDNKKNIYQIKEKIKSKYSILKEFYSDAETQKKMYISKINFDDENQQINYSNNSLDIVITKNEDDDFLISGTFCEKQELRSNSAFNILNNFRKNSTEKKHININKRKSIISAFATAVFIFLFIYTFTIFFKPQDISSSISIIRNSVDGVWLYAVIAATLVSVNTNFFLAWILSKNKKNIKAIWLLTFRLAIAGALSSIVSIITGMEYLGLIFWVWYMKTYTKSSTSQLVGAIAVGRLFRCFAALIIGAPFMISGTIYISEIFNSNFVSESSIIIIILLAWFGFAWINFSSALIFIFVFFKPLNKHFFKIKYYKKTKFTNNSTEFALQNYRDINDIRNTLKNFSIKSYQSRRILISIALAYIILCIQSWSVVNMVIHNNSEIYSLSLNNYWNFFEILSLKTIVVNFNYSIPLPGDFVSSEWVIQTVFNGFYSNIYSNVDSSIFSELVLNSAKQTSFLARFWTFYLPQIYKLFFVLIGLAVLKIKQNKKPKKA